MAARKKKKRRTKARRRAPSRSRRRTPSRRQSVDLWTDLPLTSGHFRVAERARRRARRNPSGGTVAKSILWLGGGAAVGGALGAAGMTSANGVLTGPAAAQGAIPGARFGVGLVSLGALAVALFKRSARETGLTTAGIGLGAVLLLTLAQSLAAPAKAA